MTEPTTAAERPELTAEDLATFARLAKAARERPRETGHSQACGCADCAAVWRWAGAMQDARGRLAELDAVGRLLIEHEAQAKEIERLREALAVSERDASALMERLAEPAPSDKAAAERAIAIRRHEDLATITLESTPDHFLVLWRGLSVSDAEHNAEAARYILAQVLADHVAQLRAEQAADRAAVRALVESLPRCEVEKGCERPATRDWDSIGERRLCCDEHDPKMDHPFYEKYFYPIDHAAPLRALQARMATWEPAGGTSLPDLGVLDAAREIRDAMERRLGAAPSVDGGLDQDANAEAARAVQGMTPAQIEARAAGDDRPLRKQWLLGYAQGLREGMVVAGAEWVVGEAIIEFARTVVGRLLRRQRLKRHERHIDGLRVATSEVCEAAGIPEPPGEHPGGTAELAPTDAPGPLDDVLTAASEQVAKWPEWKRSDDVKRRLDEFNEQMGRLGIVAEVRPSLAEGQTWLLPSGVEVHIQRGPGGGLVGIGENRYDAFSDAVPPEDWALVNGPGAPPVPPEPDDEQSAYDAAVAERMVRA